jgi:hypothetical protein
MPARSRRQGLGADPLDAPRRSLIPTGPIAPGERAEGPQEPRKERMKVRATINVDEELWGRCRGAVDQLSGPPLRLTLAAFAERAFAAELERLEAEHNNGRPYERLEGGLRRGRPLGS